MTHDPSTSIIAVGLAYHSKSRLVTRFRQNNGFHWYVTLTTRAPAQIWMILVAVGRVHQGTLLVWSRGNGTREDDQRAEAEPSDVRWNDRIANEGVWKAVYLIDVK